MSRSALPIAALVLTYNEEPNIGRCLASLGNWCNEIHVIDSGSTDGTLAICESYKAKTYFHSYVDSASQWDWAFANVNIKAPWIFLLDADHAVTPGLWAEIATTLRTDNERIKGYYSRHRYFFWGRVMHGFKPYGLRLVRKGSVHVDPSELVDMRFIVDGATTRLSGFVDENNAKENSLDFWIDKHQRFANRMAIEEVLRRSGVVHWEVSPRLGGNPDESIVWLKNLWYQLPLFVRPMAYYGYRYFFRLGFLDGVSGLVFHFLHALWFRFLIDVHIYRLHNNLREGTVGLDDLIRLGHPMQANPRSVGGAQGS